MDWGITRIGRRTPRGRASRGRGRPRNVEALEARRLMSAAPTSPPDLAPPAMLRIAPPDLAPHPATPPPGIIAGPATRIELTMTPQAEPGGPVEFTLTAYDANGYLAAGTSDLIAIETEDFIGMTLEGDMLLINPKLVRLAGGTTFFSVGFSSGGPKSIAFRDLAHPELTGGEPGLVSQFSYETAPGYEARFYGHAEGVLYRDLDGDNMRSPGEPAMAGRVLFMDGDGDGVLDPGEPTSITDADGKFSFPEDWGNRRRPIRVLSDGQAAGQARMIRDGTLTIGLRDDPAGVPDADTAYVRSLYLNVLGRAGGAAEVAGWTDRIARGWGRTDVAEAFFQSEENRERQVESMYLGLLGRAADPGARPWVDALLAGAAEGDVEAAILGSDEYQSAHRGDDDFARGLYLDILGRPGDGPGLEAIRAQLAAGVDRATIVGQVLDSDEAHDRAIEGLYRTYLRRAPDPSASAWASALGRSSRRSIVAARGLLASDEFARRAVEDAG
ncbi:DUF4214 domain-containing protein [Tundrisphaera sp. TA3]|uniref:DUF4214 domain-containing protein n=1 Tax=Tundrisphaera sp. TA3 TaxID=3435775 RepID=UPI003EBFF13B